MSLRVRLMIGALAATLVLCTSGGLLLDRLLRAEIEDAFDQSLLTQAHAMQVLVDYDEDGYQFDWESDAAQMGGLPSLYQVRIAGSKVLRQSDAAADIGSQWPKLGAEEVEFANLELPKSGNVRACMIRFMPRIDKAARDQPQPLELLVAQSTAALDAQLQRIRLIVVVCALGALLLSVATVMLVVPRALAPLKRVSSEIAGMNAESPAPLSDTRVPRELKVVVAQLNALLARTRAVLDRERQFSAGAAHELRTPLAGLRAKLELALSRERGAAEHARIASDCLALAVSMQSLLHNLLLFARGGGELPPAAMTDVALLLKDISARFSERLATRSVRCEMHVSGNSTLNIQGELLAVILENLIGNAVEYVNDGGDIEINVIEREDGIELTVSNSGCTLTAEDAARVFEPFWRGDVARTGDGTHAGLGLAICRRLADALAVSLGANVAAGRFEVRLGLRSAKAIGQPSV